MSAHSLLATYCQIVRDQRSQEDADRMAATLWPTVALAAPGDARTARQALSSAAASWTPPVPCYAAYDHGAPTYYCSRRAGHGGDHVAFDDLAGEVLHTWPSPLAPSSQAGLAAVRRR